MSSPDAISVFIDTEQNRITRVQFSGLEFDPATATTSILKALSELLVGMPVDLSRAALEARVRAAVPFGMNPVKATIPGIAAAIHAAIGSPEPRYDRIGAFSIADHERLTADWKSYPWQIIAGSSADSPETHVALDEALADAVASGERPPTLRFWEWDRPAVVLGRCQSLANEVDAEAASEWGICLVRRMSGGGAMFVTPTGAITFSLYLPESALAGLSIRQSYEICDGWVVRGLRSLGIDAHYVPVNDIACGHGKIAGAAQARRKGVVLHHTTIAYDLDSERMARVLRLGQPKRSPRGVPSAAKVVWPLARQTSISRDDIVARLLDEFQQQFGGERGVVSPKELDTAQTFVAKKYGTPQWLQQFE